MNKRNIINERGNLGSGCESRKKGYEGVDSLTYPVPAFLQQAATGYSRTPGTAAEDKMLLLPTSSCCSGLLLLCPMSGKLSRNRNLWNMTFGKRDGPPSSTSTSAARMGGGLGVIATTCSPSASEDSWGQQQFNIQRLLRDQSGVILLQNSISGDCSLSVSEFPLKYS